MCAPRQAHQVPLETKWVSKQNKRHEFGKQPGRKKSNKNEREGSKSEYGTRVIRRHYIHVLNC